MNRSTPLLLAIAKTRTICILFLSAAILLLGSCANDEKSSASNGVNPAIENSIVDEGLLIGSWEDTSASALHFTLFKDGTARSDNMKTLLYKNWEVEGNQITFTVESIGNKTKSTNTVTYVIEALTADKLILKQDTYVLEYTKK